MMMAMATMRLISCDAAAVAAEKYDPEADDDDAAAAAAAQVNCRGVIVKYISGFSAGFTGDARYGYTSQTQFTFITGSQ